MAWLPAGTNYEGSMKISIIIPTKNEGSYIGTTLAQFEGYFEKYNLEIIVSDAGSTDSTPEIVSSYSRQFGEEHVRFVQRVGKQNIAIGRNFGATQATGDILFHMDADVQIPNKDKFFSRVLKTFERPEVVAATTPLWIYPRESGWSDRLYHFLMNLVIRLSFTFGVYLAKGECQMVRRSVFDNIHGYNESIVAGEDCNLFFRLHKEGKIAYLYQLRIYHSPRRFRKYGYIRLTLIYLREGLSLLFRRKSYTKEWTPVR